MSGVVYLTKDLHAKSRIKIGNAGFTSLIAASKERSEIAKKNGVPELTLSQKVAGLAAIGTYLTYSNVVEETVFRLIPDAVATKLTDEGKHWKTGVGSSLAFAAVHNLVDKDGKITFSKNTLPIPQFLLGLQYWKIMKDRGIKQAMLAHTVHNTVALGADIALGQYKKRQEKKSAQQQAS